MSVTTGDVIQVQGQAPIFFFDGTRHLVPNMQTFWARGFVPSLVKFISAKDMNGLPMGDPLPPSQRFEFNQKDFLGSGHYMQTSGAFSSYNGSLQADTITYTITALGGFHGAVSVVGVDQSPSKVVVFGTTPHRYGVDGSFIGQSKVEAIWSQTIDPSQAVRVGDVRVFHSWSPDSLQSAIQKAVSTLMPLVQLASSIEAIAKLSGPANVKS